MPKSKPYAFRFAIFLIATCAILTEAEAQKVYKCGNVYSQIPCTDGVGLDAKDNRTSAQKAQADATTARTAAVASQMEKERLAQEKRDLAAQAALNAPPKSKPVADTKTSKPASKKKKKKADPEFFTAQAPKAAASKTTGK
ncbi:MAG TPA: hypothetical protein PKH04_01245 [Burkholderiaceae bacterium]|nr:hypothetical protein [Rhodoferax sp.]MBP6492964.1 hypothetical protein [Rhodoferax sp.]HNW00670.1 hypothetical protein [Burkholderiaceae bacterium]HPW06132.1 hypothetical protein [Burkholderiaceae bacterium]